MFDFLKVLANNLRKGPATDPFPFGPAHTPERFRGKVHLDTSICVGCGICKSVCAGHAIHIEERADGSGYDWLLWHNTCALCGLCRHYCPTGAISMSNDWHSAHLQSEKYEWCEHHFVPYIPCKGCGAPIRRLPASITGRIYADSHVDVQRIVYLCPECRRKLETTNLEGNNHELHDEHA